MFGGNAPPIEARYRSRDAIPHRCESCGEDATEPTTLKPVYRWRDGALVTGWTCTGQPS